MAAQYGFNENQKQQLQNSLAQDGSSVGGGAFTESMEWMTKSLPWRCHRWAM